MSSEVYTVAVDAPLREALSYLPPTTGEPLMRGQSVRVPLGQRITSGVVLKKSPFIESEFKLKPIAEPTFTRPQIREPYMKWLEWLSDYYLYPIGQIMELSFPPLEKSTRVRASKRAPVIKENLESRPAPTLTPDQERTVKAIENQAGFATHLIHGVTGSGKTEVYLQLLERTLKKGRQGLVLVPEISLTPQLIDRFSSRFPGSVAVLHSHLTDREKTDQWWSAVEEKRQILIGARSALFCPLPKLDIIIIDEEHEPSYKQDEKLKYHARDAAIVLAKNLNIPIVLGSATPSLETWSNVQSGKFILHTMSERVESRPLPQIDVIDLRAVQRERKDNPSPLPHWMSDEMFAGIQETLEKGDQAALFLNRRGMAQTAQCHGCGYVAECPNCSVSLTVHAHSYLVCHYCDYSEKLKELCPDCKEGTVSTLGLGTEKIEMDLESLLPEARLARADRDEVQTRDQLEKLIEDFETEKTNLLIGTQMIAKGLDFPKLNFVGLVLADVGFHWPDLRASERSFQLLTQVSGRAGRKTSGRVVIQTYDPSHPSITYTLSNDFKGFADFELQERRDLLYPPFWRMALVRIQSSDQADGRTDSEKVVYRAKMLQEKNPAYEQIQILGPAPAPLHRLRNQFRFQVILKCDLASRLNAFCRQLLGDLSWTAKKTKVQVDIDPYSMM